MPMDPKTLPWTGGCRCGQVRFAISAPPLVSLACHCKGCQRMTGGPYSVSLIVPEAGFAVTAGEPVVGGMHGEIAHMHCPHCLSWVFTRPPGLPMVNVRATMLDDAGDFSPFVETCTAEMLPWAKTPAKHSFPQFPPEGAWMGLIQDYQSSVAASGGG